MEKRERCHSCRELISRHESTTTVTGGDGSSLRTYHEDCHWHDIYDHRKRGERLPEDQELPG